MEVASVEQWSTQRAELLKEEKAATKLLEQIVTKRRALPMVEIKDPSRFTFTTTDNKVVTLLDLFQGRKQLVIYHHMPFSASGEGCGGCSFFSDHIPPSAVLQHLQSRDTTFAATAPEAPATIEAFRQRMGWQFPFYSSQGTESGEFWAPDLGAFRLNCFFTEHGKVYLTWSTSSRGVEPVLTTYALLDMTKLGRQEGNGKRFKLHDQY